MMILKAKVPKVLVRGAEDTSDLKCKVCGEWIEHWRKLAKVGKDTDIYCCHPDHKNMEKKLADRGAHVKVCKSDGTNIPNGKMFIIPVCEKHNITEKETILIPENMLKDASPCNPRTIRPRTIRR
jgi:hypothetical protein